jgi:hypothetical protein
MGKEIILKINFDALKKSKLALNSGEKKELFELLAGDLFGSELREPMEEYIVSESALKKDWDEKEEDEAWKHL